MHPHLVNQIRFNGNDLNENTLKRFSILLKYGINSNNILKINLNNSNSPLLVKTERNNLVNSIKRPNQTVLMIVVYHAMI